MAQISEVEIGNLALSNVGEQSTIESFDEESTPARQVRLWYPRARRQSLETYNWSFARKRQILAPHPDAVPRNQRWAFRYAYPSDCLKVREIENPLGTDADAIPFTVETDDTGLQRTILTNADEATAIYTFDQSQTVMFSVNYVDALAALLASKIAFALTGKRTIATDWKNEYRRMVQEAAVADFQQEIKEQPREAEHIRARA